MPKVTIITATHNRGKTYLPRAIRSVLKQSYKDFEYLVVDDCSTDATREVVTAFAKTDKRVKYIRLDQNSGSDTKPKNTGILASKGEYICYLDDDCEFRRDHVKVLAEFLDNHKEIDVVYGDRWVLDDSKDNPGSPGFQRDFDSQFLMLRNFIDSSDVMHRRQAVYDVGGWDEKLPKFVDWNLWVRMCKAGLKFKRLPLIITDYHAHDSSKSNRVKTQMYFSQKVGAYLFVPTFDPSGCYIKLPYLGGKDLNPKVAIYTLHYDRLDYSKRMWESLQASTKYPFDWFCWDNGSKDGTAEWLKGVKATTIFSPTNVGISKASNGLLDKIGNKYQIIIKVDNDAEFKTKGWLEDIVDIWKRNCKVYISPYPEGLVHNPGGAPRVGNAMIGSLAWGGDREYYVEVTRHIGGLCAAVDARAYKDFRWTDEFLHGNQDREASLNFIGKGYMPCYLPKHRVLHISTTVGQHKKYPKYFEKRRSEKMIRYGTEEYKKYVNNN